MEAYEIVLKSRAGGRPTAKAYIEKIITGFTELKGDKCLADDSSIVGGIGYLAGMPVTVIGIEKGATTQERIKHNFGCASPEGYRKALRLMKQAEKFRRPVLTIVDTSGAFCSLSAEDKGQAYVIAHNLAEMMDIRTPILTLMAGEGGSGGALGIAVADEVWITETSTYSVISPEGCASILWKEPSKKAKAAEALKMTAEDLFELKAVDRILPENGFGNEFFDSVAADAAAFFKAKLLTDPKELIESRYQRFRKF